MTPKMLLKETITYKKSAMDAAGSASSGMPMIRIFEERAESDNQSAQHSPKLGGNQAFKRQISEIYGKDPYKAQQIAKQTEVS